MTSLNKMTPGQKARIMGFKQNSRLCRRLQELGLVPGRSIVYLRNAPLADPMEIQVGHSYLSLRHEEAALVTVELE